MSASTELAPDDRPANTPSPEDIAAALRTAGLSEVDTSKRRRAEYSSDASLYRAIPSVVAFPRAPDDAVAALRVCAELGVPLTSRGAGTSIAGNAVGTGVVLDFSKHCNKILDIDPDARTAIVQPGVILDRLQTAAAPHGLRFGPDPSTHNRCTIGGMIGNNSCGSRALRYGRTSDNVAELDFLTGDGQRLSLGTSPDISTNSTLKALHEFTLSRLALIRTEFGTFDRQGSGYPLQYLLPENGFDVPKALVGTEGTCGVVLGATVNLVRAPRHTVLVVLGYPDMATAADAAHHLLAHRPIAVEGLDARMVDVVRNRRGAAAVPALPDGNGWLFVELGGDTPGEPESLAAQVIADASTANHRVVADGKEAAALWRIREDGAGLATRSHGGTAHAGWEDAAVPSHRLGDYLREFEELLGNYGFAGTPYGHFGDGCLHIRINFPLDKSGGTATFREFLNNAASLVGKYGGSMSGEHGDGRARSELLPLMYSPEAIDSFAEMKRIFDSKNLLNPGVIVRPARIERDLRIPAAKPLTQRLAFRYTDDDGNFTSAVHRCVGIGKCKADNTDSGGVMCPSYLATRDEKDSTRGRARVLQELANGSFVTDGWQAKEALQVLDLCLSCKGCGSDCPTGVDMATYKSELLHQAYRHRIRPAAHYSLGWLPKLAALASRAPNLANRALSSPKFAALGKKMAGVDDRRELPPFATRTFRQWFAEHQSRNGEPIVLWPDTFTNYFAPEIGIAAVSVLEGAGYRVRIPDTSLCCGLTWISTGQLTMAKRILRRTINTLTPAAKAGIPIVGLEPSCTAVFRGDAVELLGDDIDTSAVASATKTLAESLADRPQWTTPSLAGRRFVAQPHCHQHAVLGWDADRKLLTDAGAAVHAVGGCCGLAGNFGAERGHYDVSVAVAETALLPAIRSHPDATALADGFSCRTQLAGLAGTRALHLAELLAEPLADGGNAASSTDSVEQ